MVAVSRSHEVFLVASSRGLPLSELLQDIVAAVLRRTRLPRSSTRGATTRVGVRLGERVAHAAQHHNRPYRKNRKYAPHIPPPGIARTTSKKRSKDAERFQAWPGSSARLQPATCPYSPECVEGKFSEVRMQDPAWPRSRR